MGQLKLQLLLMRNTLGDNRTHEVHEVVVVTQVLQGDVQFTHKLPCITVPVGHVLVHTLPSRARAPMQEVQLSARPRQVAQLELQGAATPELL